MIAYRVGRATSRDESRRWNAPTRVLDDALDQMRREARRLGATLAQLRQRAAGDEFGPIRRLPEALERLSHRGQKAAAGDLFALSLLDRREHVLGVQLLRLVQVDPLPAPTEGNSKVDNACAVLYDQFTGIESWGICARRPIAGTSTWTQHSPWPSPDQGSNAWDIHHDDVKVMAKIAEYLVSRAKDLAVGMVIWNGRDWTPRAGWTAYGGLNPHRDHIHVQFEPARRGTPRKECP